MDGSIRALWVALMVISALIVGAVAGVLTWAMDQSPFAAVLAGGGACGGSLLVFIAVFVVVTSGTKSQP